MWVLWLACQNGRLMVICSCLWWAPLNAIFNQFIKRNSFFLQCVCDFLGFGWILDIVGMRDRFRDCPSNPDSFLVRAWWIQRLSSSSKTSPFNQLWFNSFCETYTLRQDKALQFFIRLFPVCWLLSSGPLVLWNPLNMSVECTMSADALSVSSHSLVVCRSWHN